LSDALDQGASHDVALGVLGRIDRLDAGMKAAGAAIAGPRRRALSRPSSGEDVHQRRGTIAMWWVIGAAAVLVGAIAIMLSAPAVFVDWFRDQATPTPAVTVQPPSPLPVPSPTEAYVGQARALFAGGKLRDALRALDHVPVGDALRPDAERIRADIQRELLAVAGAEASSASTLAAPVSPPKE
jgi:hypothetical protein